MKRISQALLTTAAAAILGMGVATAQQDLAEESAAEVKPPFSGQANVEYARALWKAMEDANFVGEDSIVTFPYVGTPPHGAVLELIETEFTFAGHTDLLIVKKNYAVEGEEEEIEQAVLNNRMENLDSVTVMFQREEGYDPDHQNWFWAKYAPGGALATNPKDMALAGRVAKGADQGCIACHQAAEGGDYIYSHDKYAQ